VSVPVLLILNIKEKEGLPENVVSANYITRTRGRHPEDRWWVRWTEHKFQLQPSALFWFFRPQGLRKEPHKFVAILTRVAADQACLSLVPGVACKTTDALFGTKDVWPLFD